MLRNYTVHGPNFCQGSRSCSRTWSALKATTYVPYVERAVPLRHAHFKLNRAFTVTKGHSYWCRRNPEWSVIVKYTNVELISETYEDIAMENYNFLDFNHSTPVLRQLSGKSLRISTNILLCQKLELLTYIFLLMVSVYVYKYFSRSCLWQSNPLSLKCWRENRV